MHSFSNSTYILHCYWHHFFVVLNKIYRFLLLSVERNEVLKMIYKPSKLYCKNNVFSRRNMLHNECTLTPQQDQRRNIRSERECTLTHSLWVFRHWLWSWVTVHSLWRFQRSLWVIWFAQICDKSIPTLFAKINNPLRRQCEKLKSNFRFKVR